MSSRVNIGWGEALLLISTIVLTDFAGGLYFIPSIPKGGPFPAAGPVWRPMPGTRAWTVKEPFNPPRSVTNTYFQDGFKRWGNPASANQKILILGDSFTEMPFVSNGEEWYSYLEKALPHAEFFVFGSSGYGSLQEYMILDEQLGKIQPDILLWQFCENDFQDNYYPGVRKRYPYAHIAFRPYLENNQIVYRKAVPLQFFRNHSVLSFYLLNWFDRFLKGVLSRSESEDSDKLHPSRIVTKQIMQLVSGRTQKIRRFLFDACAPLGEAQIDLCKENGFTCIRNVYETVVRGATRGHPTMIMAGHWNKKGNEIAGNIFVQFFKEHMNSERSPNRMVHY